MAKIKGCDISKWQGIVDFNALKSVVDFVIIRSSYGTGYTDAQFARNRDEARRVGLLLGYYHYAYPNNNTPEAEAEWFCKVIGTPNKGEVICLDFEESYTDPVGWSLRFLDRVSAILGGYLPLIYLNQSLIKNYVWKPVIDKSYGLWLAQYDYNYDGTPVSTPWPVVAMRQYSNKETFAGISGGVDADVFYGDKTVFQKYGYQGQVVTPTPTPTPTIEKIGKDQVLKDVYTFLCGGFSEEEIAWRLQSNKNLVEIGTDICNGDNRFFDKWVKPNIPEPQPVPQPVPAPNCEAQLQSLKDQVKAILLSKNFFWTKLSLIKKLVGL